MAYKPCSYPAYYLLINMVHYDNQIVWRLGEWRQRCYYSLNQRITGMNCDDIMQLRDEPENNKTCELLF